MMTNLRNALVVEGGGMRGAFTCGVLDAFLQQNFNPFDLFVGVSSGSTNLANYLAKQHGRNIELYLDHSLRPEFIRYGRFFKGGDLLDMQWMWDTVEKENPLDQNTLFAQNPDFYMVLTHARSGHAEYLRAGKDNIIDGLRASSSIPYLTRKAVDIFDEPYFDGGVADALPVQWAAQQSNIKNLLVIRTRTQSYFKASSKADQFFAKYLMNQYAGFSDSLKQRCQRYNATIDFMRQNNQQGILEVCPPDDKMLAGRLCKDKRKLQYTYEVGLDCGRKAIEDWERFSKQA
ncbi:MULTISPECIES: patatin-like phospholipase family protein [Acinetobacter]|uniref:patatin-like phospholipase family protein n=1 Tax=Acinetobacter TaxID=469 RepID=UPI000C2B6BDF|nr:MULTISPECIES: patatin family protein [Acinetobacter]ATZ65138.1 patatin family protein [Acinetobacter bereziniae]MBJ8424082.1 patatin family protein [Acinetobacter bereziniae]MCU4476641.1 patatin family protein [Acinetobacter bereziniae]MDQ9818033.1 patatin family protein [Acinetobacter bereziniae]BCX72360.1 patatin family protein [Acinetobacter sp. Tol 5]